MVKQYLQKQVNLILLSFREVSKRENAFSYKYLIQMKISNQLSSKFNWKLTWYDATQWKHHNQAYQK